MKALSLWQPWASRIASGEKTIETRMWSTRYRGPLLICATKRPIVAGLPSGCAVAVVRLVDCRPMRDEDQKAAGCLNGVGQYAWVLTDIQSITPFPVRGEQGLFDVDDELVAKGD